MVGSLRAVGFDYVFDTNYTADLTIVEEAAEFVRRLERGGPFPMFTSCCPAWINLCEKHYPQLLPQLSTCKSPQGMMGALVKRWFANRIGRDPRDIVLVSIMPCVAKKDEIARPQLWFDHVEPQTGRTIQVPETDYVLTTRELGHLPKNEDIHFASIKPSAYDRLLGESSGAAALFAVTGGVLEAALRTAYETVTKTELPAVDFQSVRGLGTRQGGVRSATIPIPLPLPAADSQAAESQAPAKTLELKVAVAHGTKHVRDIVEQVLQGGSPYNDYHLIEVMACPGGCIGGGGQAKSVDPDILRKRAAAVYEIDAKKEVRRSHKNTEIQWLYRNYLTAGPGGRTSHATLHTSYTDRSGAIKHHADAQHPEPLRTEASQNLA